MLRQDTLIESIMEVAKPSTMMDEDDLHMLIESLDEDAIQELDDETLEFLIQYLDDEDDDNDDLTVEELDQLAEVMASLDEDELSYLNELSDKLLNRYADRANSEIRTMQSMNPKFQPRKRLQKRIKGERAAVHRMLALPKDRDGKNAMDRMFDRQNDYIGTENWKKERRAGLEDLDGPDTPRPKIDRRKYWRNRP